MEDPWLNIVLHEPEIPQNTGNIARTCAAAGARLHLIHPLGFSLESKYVKRAGLDYWDLLSRVEHPSLEAFWESMEEDAAFFLITTKAAQDYGQADFSRKGPLYLIFGKETKGLPEDILNQWPGQCLRLPMIPSARSLNLSNCAAVLAYRALEARRFPGLTRGSSS